MIGLKPYRLMLLMCLMVLALAGAPGRGIAQIIEFSYKSFNLERDEDNIIQNASALDKFYESLYQQKSLNDRKISIIHIGDSHIQADFMTSVIRRNFQTHFGNAGRGLIVPYRVAGTNEPFNLYSTSDVRWIAKRCVHVNDPLPIGIGGITIQTTVPGSHLRLMMNDLWMDYHFNIVKVFHAKGSSSYELLIKDTSGIALPATVLPGVHHSSFMLPALQNGVVLQNVKTGPSQKTSTIFGISLENSSNGVLYHAIGVNGAKYQHYNAARYFVDQSNGLDPHLIIVSLGTNEAVEYVYPGSEFTSHLDKLITGLKQQNPGADFIIVTPPDSFRKKTKHNPAVAIIRQQIVQYAVENGLAFYDMYKALGGDQSASGWRQAGLLRPDGVHFSKEGYEYQGNLFFQAIIKAYNEYVPLRHQ